jgi:hypothetical protein
VGNDSRSEIKMSPAHGEVRQGVWTRAPFS